MHHRVSKDCVHIIDENIFDQAQFILNQRSSKNEEKKQIAKTTKGSTLLSGNIYCAHCGQKMVSTSYIDRYNRADGSQYRVRRQRYICTNKAMKRGACDSQFRTWADEFDNSTMEQKKMIACQLIREVKVSRGYELEIVFDLNYEQFLFPH